ncbi:MAG TPA: hypothetical protein VFJ61_07495 [Solirubrobacterales bacterium]|nr:hypothetical protein [Solirubrobacterales bacterium]
MAKLFGFVQFEFAGTLPLADGRYLAEASPGEKTQGEEADQSVLVLQRIGAPASPPRRRRRSRAETAEPAPQSLPLTRVTAVRASSPFEDQAGAARWLDEACEAEDTVEVLAAEAVATLNRALHALAVSAADPHGREVTPEQAVRVLIGYASGEEAADGRYSDARQVDLDHPAATRRQRREEELRPQERVASVLRGRERLAVCETLLLRARADLDAGREGEAALQLRIGVEALLAEMKSAVNDPGHEKDISALEEQQTGIKEAASAALAGTVGDEQRERVADALRTAERVLRRRRVLEV